MIVIRAPRRKLLLLLACSLLLVGASAWLIVGSPVWPLTIFPGGLGTLFFGLCGGWILSRLFSNRVSLILNREGLLDNSSAIPAGRIAWEQISRVGLFTVSSQRFLGIDVKDRAALASQTSAFGRWLNAENAGITGYPVNIPSTAIDRSIEDLQALIERYWKKPDARAELESRDLVRSKG